MKKFVTGGGCKLRFWPVLLALMLAVMFLVACDGRRGGGGSSSSGSEGEFVDASHVAGLEYVTESLSGTTDEDGVFRYRRGEMVTFLLGDLVLGSAMGTDVLTTYDISNDELYLEDGGSYGDDQRAINISRLLRALDADGDPSNGIELVPEASEVPADLDLNDIAAIEAALGRIFPDFTLDDEEEVRSDLEETMAALPTPAHAEQYTRFASRRSVSDSCDTVMWSDAEINATLEDEGTYLLEGSIAGNVESDDGETTQLEDTFSLVVDSRGRSRGWTDGDRSVSVQPTPRRVEGWTNPHTDTAVSDESVAVRLTLVIDGESECYDDRRANPPFVLLASDQIPNLPPELILMAERSFYPCDSALEQPYFIVYKTLPLRDLDGHIPSPATYEYVTRDGKTHWPFTAEKIKEDSRWEPVADLSFHHIRIELPCRTDFSVFDRPADEITGFRQAFSFNDPRLIEEGDHLAELTWTVTDNEDKTTTRTITYYTDDASLNDDDGTADGAVAEACEDLSAKVDSCPDLSEAVTFDCERAVSDTSEAPDPGACEDAVVNWMNCVEGLSCSQLHDLFIEMDDYCMAEEEAADAVCL